ncbi:MAG: GTP 3',8-cyclase MoaA [Planctomycetota bacterium]
MSVVLPILDSGPQRPAFARGPRSLDAVKLLRLSLTDRCNLRCVYCMPDDGVSFYDHHDLLSADDIVSVAAAARGVGVTHFKLTGGEPTLRKDLLPIVERLAALSPADLSMTTNGIRLGQHGGRLAHQLRDAGLDRLTISLDSLDPDTFARLTGRRGFTLDQAWAGIDAAVAAGFEALKLNVVVVGGINDHEVADFAALTHDRPWTVRFIEYMPLGDSALTDHAAGAETFTVDNQEIIRRIEAVHGSLLPVERDAEPGVGPAVVFRTGASAGRRQPGAAGGGGGRLGFISAMSRPFCETCNRLRLTARGELRACLFDGGEVDLLPTLRAERVDPGALRDLMARCVAEKPETHSPRGNRAMSQLGG